jgi:phage terminase large subunit-like protein
MSVDEEKLSLAERLALLPDDERRATLADFEREGHSFESLQFDMRFWLRPRQLEAIDSEDWITAIIAGRGFGKSLTLAQWVREKARLPGTRIALVGRTVADVRDTMVQGESGILAVHSPEERPEYVPSLRRLTWPNGSLALTHTSSEPSQLRGPSFHYSACDELSSWRHVPDDSGLTAWDNVKIATRLGDNPQVFIATTPKRHKVIRDLFEQSKDPTARVKLINGSTLDNRANLADAYLDALLDRYRGTTLARQELMGELLDVVEGALWREEDIVGYSLKEDVHGPLVHVVGVDPGVTTKGDATGIVVVYGTRETTPERRVACVMEDLTEPGLDPDRWAARVANAARNHKHADGTPALVVAESNQGGELVRSLIAAQDAGVKVKLVHASQNKAARADPIVLAYRRRRITHHPSADLDELVDEMTSWELGSGWSPNHMDALVHACRAVVVEKTVPGPLGIYAPSDAANVAYDTASLPLRPDPRGQTHPRLTGIAGFR